jgi:hypothetical protein
MNTSGKQDYPYTPTIAGLRTGRHSLMISQGVWDIAELYGLQDRLATLPGETGGRSGKGSEGDRFAL